MSRKRDRRITFSQHFLSSGVAGVTSRTLTAPLDVIKIRTQVGTADSRCGYSKMITDIFYREGMRGFWKGNLMGCIRLMPYSTIQLIAFHRLRMLLADSCGRIGPTAAFLAGSGAGLTATLVMFPTDTVKTRLIVQHSNQRWAHYSGILDAFRQIIGKEGIGALYRGVSTSILGTVPYAATMFLCFEVLDTEARHRNLPATPYRSLMQGCMAAVVAQTVTFPMDTIRRKMQAYSYVLPNRGGVDIKFDSMRAAFRETVKRRGILGLWRGNAANVIKVVPYSGLMFSIFEFCKNLCLFANGYTLNPFKEVHHPLVDQSLNPSQLENFLSDEEDTDDSWMQSEED